MEDAIIKEAAQLAEKGIPFCLCTVVESVGSTPRRSGAMMLVRTDGVTCGTVGGGTPERMVNAEALLVLTEGKPRTRSFDLDDPEKTDTGSVCGGRLTIFFDPHAARVTAHLFGAGHVSLPTSRLLSSIGYAVHIYDASSDFANKDRFPEAIGISIGNLAELAAQIKPAKNDIVVILTASHVTDYDVVRTFRGRIPSYLGVIGSKKKALHYREMLTNESWPKEEIDRIHSPIGLQINSRTPEEIAVSIAAEIISLRGPSE